MGNLSIYLPPFAVDYSGVCSALFDMDCMLAINDAGCCTSHYVYYDEPRWGSEVKPVFCTMLRNIDAVLGCDDKLVRRLLDAAEEIETELIAVVGTPVPAITGMDMEGIAMELESASGRPAMGFDTTGFKYYDKGIAMAGSKLIKKYARRGVDAIPGTVNIIGYSPIDYGNVGSAELLRQELTEAGFTVNTCLFSGTTTDQIRSIAAAEVNLAVSAGGVMIAAQLRRQFGTPFTAGFPMGGAHTAALFERLRRGETAPAARDMMSGDALLLIGDQVICCSIREALWEMGCARPIVCATFFTFDPELALPGDFHISSERALIERLRQGGFRAAAGDPIVRDIPELGRLPYVSIVHPAVSSNLLWHKSPKYGTDEFRAVLEELAKM